MRFWELKGSLDLFSPSFDSDPPLRTQNIKSDRTQTDMSQSLITIDTNVITVM